MIKDNLLPDDVGRTGTALCDFLHKSPALPHPPAPLSLLYISDLHFREFGIPELIGGASNSALKNVGGDESEIFLEELKKHLNRCPSPDYWPKAVIVNGDLVDKGRENGPAKFEKATQFLMKLKDTLDIGPDRIYVVPGNHDVDWSLGSEASYKERFQNYHNAVKDFYATFDYDDPSPIKVELNELQEGIDAELFLLMSPTPSGAADTESTKDVVRVDVERAYENGSQEGASQKERGEFDIGIVGRTQSDKLLDLITETESMKEESGSDPIRIAVLHHHLLPDSGINVSPYEAVIDAGCVLDRIKDKFDLVLTGHKHNRRLVRHGRGENELDIYSGPTLFKAYTRSAAGFTIIDIMSAEAETPYYVRLRYFDTNCTLVGWDDLLREGRVIPKVNEICAGLSHSAQQVMIPLLESVRDALKWSKDHPAEDLGFFKKVWDEVEGEINRLGKQKLVLRRPPPLHVPWSDLVKRVVSEEHSSESRPGSRNDLVRLVSEDGLDFWLMRKRHVHTDAAKYEKELRKLENHKTRILVMDSNKLQDRSNESIKLAWVVRSMIKEGYRVGIIRKEKEDLRYVNNTDFGIVGDLAVVTFDEREISAVGAPMYPTTLTVHFSKEDLKKANDDWDYLMEDLDWYSEAEDGLDIRDWISTAYMHDDSDFRDYIFDFFDVEGELEDTWKLVCPWTLVGGRWELKKRESNGNQRRNLASL